MSSVSVKIDAPCKINLTLDVFSPRTDGFHPLDSVVATFTPTDTLTVEVSDASQTTIELICDDPHIPGGEDNLACRAARIFAERFLIDRPQKINVQLTKRLPHQAGLGGGSSDAAAVLLALASLYLVDTVALSESAAALGSDVPLFLADGPVRMRGRGEIIELLSSPLPDLFGVIVKPSVGVPTGSAFQLLDSLPNRRPGESTLRLLEMLTKLKSPPINAEALGAAMHNDFEPAIFPAFPEIAAAHRAVAEAGAVRALLCGSGAAIFGLALDRAHAESMANVLCGPYPYVTVAVSYKIAGSGERIA